MIRKLPALIILVLSASAAYGLEQPYAADVNGDGKVDIIDLIVARNRMGEQSTAAAFYTDVNADGKINIIDLIGIRNNLNHQLPSREFTFDFGGTFSPAASGSTAVYPTTAYDQAHGYGWVDQPQITAEDRNWDDALTTDLIYGQQPSVFRIDLSAGTYEVLIDTAYVAGVSTVKAGVRGARVFGDNWGEEYGPAILDGRPTAAKNHSRMLDLALDQSGSVDITFYAPTGYRWAISSIKIKKDIPEIVLHDVHLAPDYEYDFTPPTRDSDLSFVSQKFGNYQQDWDYLVAWYQDVIDDSMTTDEKVQAIINKIYDTLSMDGQPLYHPVDIIDTGSGWCEHRSVLFKALMHTLGLPARGAWMEFLPSSQYGGANISTDPLWYTVHMHSVAEVFYDGKWHLYNTTFGALYSCSLAEVMADPTIAPVLERRREKPLFHADVKEILFLIDGSDWPTSGSSQEIIQYTPLTARTIYGSSLPSYPFRLQSHRPGFAAGEYVLPLTRWYRYSLHRPPLELAAGETIRREIQISPLDGVDRLRNQLNLKAAGSRIRWLVTVNGSSFEVTNTIEATSDFIPVIVDVPANMLQDGANTVDLQLLEPSSVAIAYGFERQDAELVLPVPSKKTLPQPDVFAPLPYHLFWNTDLVYALPQMRSSATQMELDLSPLTGMRHSVYLLPLAEPTSVTAGNGIDTIAPFANWNYDGTTLMLQNVPPLVRIDTQ